MMIDFLSDLTVIWAFLIAFVVCAYVDFDLGVGMLFAVSSRREDRDVVAPVWDGNETWLVMGVGGLFAAFPLA